MRLLQRALILLSILALPGVSYGYPVGPALKLEELIDASDVIFKATALSSEPVKDEWFTQYPGFDSYTTNMKVISLIKGDLPSATVCFRHYGPAEAFKGGINFMPQHYAFAPGRTYIVFAQRTEEPGVLRQLWKHHKSKEDQGVVLAADDRPVAADTPVKEIIWTELNALLKSPVPNDVCYAIEQLHGMSAAHRWYGLNDFDPSLVARAIHGFVAGPDPQIAKAAIGAIGASSPYLRDNDAAFFLAATEGAAIHGFSPRDRNKANADARTYWTDLVSVVDSDQPVEVRALAIRALGRAREDRIRDHVQRWTDDPEPLVRQAAVVLLSDFPSQVSTRRLTQASADPAHEVRIGAAQAVGLGRLSALLPLLDQLLADENAHVRTAAALSLLSFPVPATQDLLKTHVDDPDFRSVFVNALAERDPQPYLDALAEIIEKRLEPPHFWGGRIPAALSWTILFDYIKSQPPDSLESGNLDPSLNALEHARFYSSSEPRDLYAFYLQRNMTDRAKRFREYCESTFTYDIAYYFNAVDEQYSSPTGD